MHIGKTPAVVAAVVCALLALVAGPAGAVVGGQTDTSNTYANAGLLEGQFAPDQWFGFCSGTLVAQDVVLTAAHCVDFLQEVGEDGLGPADLRITFDPAPSQASAHHYVDHIVAHPDWFTKPFCRGNSKSCFLAPPAEDIALVFLSADATGITPAPIAAAGYLDELDLTSETFTVVGYGLDGFATGSLLSPVATVIDDGARSYRDVSAITEHDLFPDRFVKITQSTCFGDSGGPLFHEGTVVAINTWTFSTRCDGPNLEYRVDSPVAQAFLDANLD